MSAPSSLPTSPRERRWRPVWLAAAVLLAACAVGASGAQAQAVRLELGRTSSGVRWLLPRPEDPQPGQVLGGASNTDRRSFYLAGRARLDAAPWLGVESGLGLVPKGFEVTGPTFHMLYVRG